MSSSANPIVHRRKLYDGKTSAPEVYAAVVFKGKACTACASPKVVLRVQSFLPVKDIDHAIRSGLVAQGVRLMVEAGNWPKVPLKDGPGIRVGELFACAACRAEAERVAARLPSYMPVVFDRLPDEHNPLVSVASQLILPAG